MHHVCTFLLLMSISVTMANNERDYTEDGPFLYTTRHWRNQATVEGNANFSLLQFTVTTPKIEIQFYPYPVVLFIPGFKMLSSYYKDYVHKLASYGYLVVQYDVPRMKTFTDKTEITFFPLIMKWLSKKFETGELVGVFDFNRIAVVGHSRGGKLATLIALKNSVVKSLYLIDPVNGDDQYAPESENYPSAVRALTGKGWKIGISGSSISGSCNPTGYDFKEFWKVAGDGSWLFVVEQAGHCQFFTAPFLAQVMLDRLCSKGKTTCKEVIGLTYPCMLAWIQRTLPLEESDWETGEVPEKTVGKMPLTGFFDWVQRNVRSRRMSFEEKRNDSFVF